jgi:uncharacterized membrane protein YbhN (UPF0104 family)
LSTGKIDFKRWVPILTVLVALIGLVFIVADWGRISKALSQATWEPLPFALAATLISYACVGLSFARVSKLLGVEMHTKDLAIVGFVSSVLNHLVLSGGAAGYSVRFMLMNRHGVSLREIFAISILHFLLTGLWMVLMLPVGLAYLGASASLGGTTAMLLIASASVVSLGTLLATGLAFWGKLRRKAIRLLALGIQAMRQEPASMLIIASLILIDWAFSAATLWFCFRAFEVTLTPGQLVSGFVIGTVAGVASLLPGGLGIQEVSMTGIFALLGITLEKAVVASVLYRVVYSIIPYVVSLGFYRLVLRQEDNSPITQEAEYENPYT